MQNALEIDACQDFTNQNLKIPQQVTSSLFDKYKQGCKMAASAFKLCSQNFICEQQSKETPASEGRNRGSYRKYSTKEKQNAVEKIMHGHDVKEVAKQFGIPRRNLVRWRKNGCVRKEGGGRPTDHEMEMALYDKIRSRQIRTEKQIRAAAILVSKSQNFKASKGWFSKFSRRYKLRTGEDLLRSE